MAQQQLWEQESSSAAPLAAAAAALPLLAVAGADKHTLRPADPPPTHTRTHTHTKPPTDIDLGARIDEVQGAIDPVAFLRDYVAANKPLIVRGGAAHWPAARRGGARGWTRAYLERAAGDAEVTVDVTPNGRGDAVTPYGPDGKQLCFCTPHQRRMEFREFLDFFFSSKQAAAAADTEPHHQTAVEVPYLQHQNSNLTVELPALLADVEEQLPWSDVFGSPPDAVNLWIGDGRAATTFHKVGWLGLRGDEILLGLHCIGEAVQT
jgi:hypothetical protein